MRLVPAKFRDASFTVAVVQAEAEVAQAEFFGPVWPRQPGGNPASVVPAAVGLWVHFQTRLQKWQLSFINLLHLVLVPTADFGRQEQGLAVIQVKLQPDPI